MVKTHGFPMVRPLKDHAFSHSRLESEHVSQMLPSWIDLIFGFKQSGEPAVAWSRNNKKMPWEGKQIGGS